MIYTMLHVNPIREKDQINQVKATQQLKDAFNMLYAFTCDGKGIRHAGNINTSDSTFAEAEFMMVACSAFINYLRCIESN